MGIPPAPRGVPQIEVTFDVDANGILNVTAEDKSTGRSNKITIRNDKGRLSKADIDRMLNDAERFHDEDERHRQRVSARNQLESYAFSVRNALQDHGDRLSSSDKSKAQQAVDEALKWLDKNSSAEKDELEYRFNELQRTCSPIMSRIHQGASGYQQSSRNGAYGNGGGNNQQNSGPRVEEVD